uniref:Uncharacterized protein n=1 Tax=Plectus sambesii TaxID=2011161 RepID=A0A914XJ35_9BILA
MAVCRTLSRPLMPSLESAVVSAAPKSAAATVEDDVEEPIILNDDDDEKDQHELVAESAGGHDDDDEEPAVAAKGSTKKCQPIASVSRARTTPKTKVVRIDSDSSDEDIEELSPQQLMAPPSKPPQRVPKPSTADPSPSKKPLKLSNGEDVQKNVDEMIKDFVID